VDDVRSKEVTRLLKRGLNYYGLGDVHAAIDCWEQARRLDPENRAVHDYLETAYEEVDEKAPGEPRVVPADEDDATPISESVSVPSVADVADEDPTPLSQAEPVDPFADDDPDTLIQGALEAYKSGRLDDAWTELQRVADSEPERLDVQGYLQLIRADRAKTWAREIGDQGRLVNLQHTTQELMSLKLSPDEGFLLSQIDGSLTLADLISLSSSDRVRTLEILARLLREGIIG
jgi:tetratricopeptide (TPR) repeat protein